MLCFKFVVMEKRNLVYIGQSLDGFIADKDGGIDWLNAVPNPDQDDLGYGQFMSQIDAIIMGRTTFEKVDGFNIPWPYTVPVFVLSSQLTQLPEKYKEKVFLLHGTSQDILAAVHEKGFGRLYIDGGRTVQRFLKDDLIDEIIITTIPIILGEGFPLFAVLANAINLDLKESKVLLNQVVQSTYVVEKK